MPPKGQFRTCELLPGSSENIRRTATNPVERYEHGFVFCYVQLSAMDAPASMADLFWDSKALESLRKVWRRLFSSKITNALPSGFRDKIKAK